MNYKTSHLIEINGVEWEADCVISYTVSEGQEARLNAAPEDCQPGYPPEVEVELLSATISGGLVCIDLKEYSWFDKIEEDMNEDEDLLSELMDDYNGICFDIMCGDC